MVAFRGECTITLDGIELALQFRSFNIKALQEITGKTPPEFFARFEGLGADDSDTAAKLCDFEYVVALIQAGLAKHPKYRKVKLDVLEDRICTLIDNESDKLGVPSFNVVARCMVEIFPAIVAALSGPTAEEDKGDANQGNEQPPVAAAGAESTSVGAD